MRPVVEDLDADLRALLDAAAPGVAPPSEARGRVARRLALSLAALPAATTASWAARAARPSHIARAMRKTGAWVPKPVMVAFVTGALAGVGGYAALRRPAADPAPRVEPGVDTNAAPPPCRPPNRAPNRSSKGPSHQSRRLPARHHARPAFRPLTRLARREHPDLDAERRILDVGRQRSPRVNPRTCSGPRGSTSAVFPEGVLVEEREALAVQALVTSSRFDEAQARADRFVAKFPEASWFRWCERRSIRFPDETVATIPI